MKAKRINIKYSPEFKISCIIDMRNNCLGYRETARKYNLPNHNYLVKWERIFLEEGEAGLYLERRGRTTKMDNPMKGRPKKVLNSKIEQDLISENQRLKEENQFLRMQNEYLKKLDALVRAEEQLKGKKPK